MGHSYIELDGRSVHLNDTDIDVARHFLISAAKAFPPSTEIGSLRAFLDEWQCYGTGVFGTDLGQFVGQSAERRSLLQRVITAASELSERFGEQVPVEYLGAAQLTCGIFTGHYPVARARETLGQLRVLVTGDPNRD